MIDGQLHSSPQLSSFLTPCRQIKMKHLAAYLLANLSGNTPTNENIKDILSSVGIEADEARLSLLFSSLGGKDLNAVK